MFETECDTGQPNYMQMIRNFESARLNQLFFGHNVLSCTTVTNAQAELPFKVKNKNKKK